MASAFDALLDEERAAGIDDQLVDGEELLGDAEPFGDALHDGSSTAGG